MGWAARVLVSLIAGVAVVNAQTDGPAHLVKNINQTSDPRGSSNAYAFTAAGDYIYFLADDGVHGSELWRSDRTPGGTVAWRELGFAPELAHAYQLIPYRGDLL